MPAFTSGIEIDFLGYKYLYRQLSLSFFTPSKTGDNTIPSLVETYPNLPPFIDPRGLFEPGMMPSSEVSYRVYTEVNQSIISGGESVTGASPILFSLPEVVTSPVYVKYAVVMFEGHDVIDLPTDNLIHSGEGLVLPNNVFRVYHAGSEKLMESGSNVSLNTSVAYWSNTSDNLFRKIVPSEGVAKDARQIASNQGKYFVDTNSRTVQVDGSPSYISYTSVDRTLFRDVVIVRSSVLGFGISSSVSSFILTETAPGPSYFHVLRFVLFNKSSTDNLGLEPKWVWRLSESYNIDPQENNTNTTPNDLLQSSEQISRDASDRYFKHYVYDLAESIEDDDVSDDFVPVPLKQGYSPLLAESKKDPSSPYYDVNFKSSVIDIVPGYASLGGVVTYHSALATQSNSSIAPALSYTSPKLGADMGKSGRIGIEYVVGNTKTGTRVTDTVLLSSTKESSPGIGIAYDYDRQLALVVESISSIDGNVISERIVDDVLWTVSRPPLPTSKLGEFIRGDFLLRSHGGISFVPAETEMGVGSEGEFTSTSEKNLIPTSLIAASIGGKSVLELKEGAEGKPLIEFVSQFKFSGKILMRMPPIRFSYIVSGNVVIDKFYGSERGSVFAESMKGTSVNTLTLGGLQLSQVEEQNFPVLGNNISVTCDSANGWLYLAFENGNRIDFAMKRAIDGTWFLIRDVILRVPDEANTLIIDTESPPEFPPCTIPFLVSDPQRNFLFLFYAYKKHILVKQIPIEILDTEPTGSFRYTIESEVRLSTRFQNIRAYVVYDGAGDEDQDNGGLLVDDYSVGAIQTQNTIVEPQSQNVTTDETEAKPPSQMSAFMTASGYLFVFIEIDGRIIARKSPNLGGSWGDVFPQGTNFIGSTEQEKTGDGTELPVQESPSCLYDPIFDTVVLFYFVENVLLCIKIPVEIMLDSKVKAGSLVSSIRPVALAGPVTQELIDRGIGVATSVLDQGDEPPPLIPHRTAGYVTTEGYYRIFFRDQDQRMKSLFSFNAGDDWFTDKQLLPQEEE